MEVKFTLLDDKFLVELKEKEDIIVALQDDLEQCTASNATSSFLDLFDKSANSNLVPETIKHTTYSCVYSTINTV